MGPIRIDGMFDNVLAELDAARNALSEAASWARSDWSDERGLTDEEAQARTAVFDLVGQAKDGIDQIKSLVYHAQQCPRQRRVPPQRDPAGVLRRARVRRTGVAR